MQFALLYLRRHPGHARAVSMGAVAPTSIKLPLPSPTRQIVVPNGGHNNGGPCLDRLRIAFLD